MHYYGVCRWRRYSGILDLIKGRIKKALTCRTRIPEH